MANKYPVPTPFEYVTMVYANMQATGNAIGVAVDQVLVHYKIAFDKLQAIDDRVLEMTGDEIVADDAAAAQVAIDDAVALTDSDSVNAWLETLAAAEEGSVEHTLFHDLRKLDYASFVHPAWIAAGSP